MEDTENKTATPDAETPAQPEGGAAETPEPCCTCESGADQALAALEEQVAEVQEKLAAAEKQAAEYLDGWQRSQAAFSNFRKRAEVEQTQWRQAANAALLSRLLPVLDDFDRAFAVMPAALQGDAWLEGLYLVQRKVQSILDAENAKPLELKVGDPFDPMYHHAVLYQETTDFQEGQIMAEVQKGYILGERLLRPAMVVVAKAPAAQPAPKVEEAGGSDIKGEESSPEPAADQAK